MAIQITVRVVPRASKSEIVGLENGILKIRLTAPPVDRAANAEMIRLLAKSLSIAKRDITIVSGETSRNKRISIDNVSQSKLDGILK